MALSICKWDTHTSGVLAEIPLMAAFATAARNSPLSFLFGIPFERRIAYHKRAAIMANNSAILHGVIAFVSRDATRSDHHARLVTGLCAGVCSVMLILSSLPPIRRRAYDLFLSAQWVFFTLYLVFLVLHHAKGIFISIALFLIDITIRKVYTSMFQPKEGTLTHIIGTNIVEVSVEGVRYRAGQYVFLSIPEIGSFQWHPISFSSAPCEGPVAKFHIRCAGDWGQRLMSLALQKPDEKHKILLDGAYGCTSIDIDSEK
eukprot:TRINITY_DN185_c4_g1_i1.p1 TRINITY_DN185_c4_g1~~TRINITY_DN185_c4_g1_i1.p1  ORF type:complete len:259 (+),score=45.91 TRINITY_DN185_c4_g1_i1:218-994(+)